jgi:hypothetical protein
MQKRKSTMGLSKKYWAFWWSLWTQRLVWFLSLVRSCTSYSLGSQNQWVVSFFCFNKLIQHLLLILVHNLLCCWCIRYKILWYFTVFCHERCLLFSFDQKFPSGLSGGAIFVPLLILVGYFTPSGATAMSQVYICCVFHFAYLYNFFWSNHYSKFYLFHEISFCLENWSIIYFLHKALILGSSIAVFIFSVPRRHPKFDRPLIDYTLALVLVPPSLIGILSCNYVLHSFVWLLLCCSWITNGVWM